MDRVEWLTWWRARGEAELREIIYTEWNPIGFPGVLPEDEYDSYLGPIASRLEDGASVGELADHLCEVRKRIVPSDDPATDRRVAERLHEWYRASLSGD